MSSELSSDSGESTNLMHGLGKPSRDNTVIMSKKNNEESKRQEMMNMLNDPLEDSDYEDEPIELNK